MAVQSYARVDNGIVAELWPHDPVAPMPDPQPGPTDVFGPDFGKHFVPCDPSVKPNWTYDGKVFAAPVPAQVTPPVPTATGLALLSAMTDDQAKAWQTAVDAGTPAVRAYWANAYRVPLPLTSPKLARLAKTAGLDLVELFAAAVAA